MPGHYTDVMGGAQYQAKCLIDALDKTGKYEIYFTARNVDPDYKPSHYSIKKVPRPLGLKRARLFLDVLPLYRILKEIQPDIIYQRVASAYTGIAAIYAHRNHCKLVWHISSDADVKISKFRLTRDLVLKYIDTKLMQYGIRNADQIIAQTNAQARMLSEYYGIEPNVVVPNFHPFPNEAISKSYPVKVLWIANLKKLKQPEIFIKLAEDLRDLDNVEFIMMGEKQGSDKWKRNLSERIEKASKLKYLGAITQDQVNGYLAQSHILVNTSKFEGFSNTFIQAWMRNVPVVSLHVNPDNLLDGDTLGYCAGTYNALLGHVKYLIENSLERDRMGEAARNYAIEHHSVKNAESLISVFDQLSCGN